MSCTGSSPTSNNRLSYGQGGVNQSYFFFVHSFFSNLCTAQPYFTAPKANLRPDFKGETGLWQFWTATDPVFNKFRKMFYGPNGIKIVP